MTSSMMPLRKSWNTLLFYSRKVMVAFAVVRGCKFKVKIMTTYLSASMKSLLNGILAVIVNVFGDLLLMKDGLSNWCESEKQKKREAKNLSSCTPAEKRTYTDYQWGFALFWYFLESVSNPWFALISFKWCKTHLCVIFLQILATVR